MKNFIQQRKQLRISTTEQPTSLLITETKIGGIIAKIERSTETTRQGSLSKNVSVSLMPKKKKVYLRAFVKKIGEDQLKKLS